MRLHPIDSNIEANLAVNKIHDEIKNKAYMDSLSEGKIVDDSEDFLTSTEDQLEIDKTINLEEFLDDTSNRD